MLGKKTSKRGRNPLVWLAPQPDEQESDRPASGFLITRFNAETLLFGMELTERYIIVKSNVLELMLKNKYVNTRRFHGKNGLNEDNFDWVSFFVYLYLLCAWHRYVTYVLPAAVLHYYATLLVYYLPCPFLSSSADINFVQLVVGREWSSNS